MGRGIFYSKKEVTMRLRKYLSAVSLLVFAPALAVAAEYKPVTEDVLLKPEPADWLMINRTYDEQRFSPLSEINRTNLGTLQLAWTRGLPQGTQESSPIVHQGVMYVIAPGGAVQALDGTNGDQIAQSVALEESRDFPGHGLFRRAGRLSGGARCPQWNSAVADEGARLQGHLSRGKSPVRRDDCRTEDIPGCVLKLSHGAAETEGNC
jgi:hypothetical protein